MKKFFEILKQMYLLLLERFGCCSACGSRGPHDIKTQLEVTYGVGFDGICASSPEEVTLRSVTCKCGHVLSEKTMMVTGLAPPQHP